MFKGRQMLRKYKGGKIKMLVLNDAEDIYYADMLTFADITDRFQYLK